MLGFDNVLAPALDGLLQKAIDQGSRSPLLTFSSWRLCFFGLALIQVMRFRPEGLLPSRTGMEPAGEGVPGEEARSASEGWGARVQEPACEAGGN